MQTASISPHEEGLKSVSCPVDVIRLRISVGKLRLTKLVKIIEAFSRIWPIDLLETEPREVANALTTVFLWRVAVIGSNLDALQPWTVRKKVLDRYSLVLGQCLDNVLRFLRGRSRYSAIPL